MKKINKNYYKIEARPVCSVFLDEYLMKKVNKVLYKYTQEIEALLENNNEHLIPEQWSLVYPNKKQVSFYGVNCGNDDIIITIPKFDTRKIENLFDLDGKSIYSDEVKKEITKLLK